MPYLMNFADGRWGRNKSFVTRNGLPRLWTFSSKLVMVSSALSSSEVRKCFHVALFSQHLFDPHCLLHFAAVSPPVIAINGRSLKGILSALDISGGDYAEIGCGGFGLESMAYAASIHALPSQLYSISPEMVRLFIRVNLSPHMIPLGFLKSKYDCKWVTPSPDHTYTK
ncbi:hypothetical protein NC651_026440 [Populus alba x Populus x berolinensis]|nr:hypothetical protein NC651_026440 [Populus alba x Populus x berolinensis]